VGFNFKNENILEYFTNRLKFNLPHVHARYSTFKFNFIENTDILTLIYQESIITRMLGHMDSNVSEYRFVEYNIVRRY